MLEGAVDDAGFIPGDPSTATGICRHDHGFAKAVGPEKAQHSFQWLYVTRVLFDIVRPRVVEVNEPRGPRRLEVQRATAHCGPGGGPNRPRAVRLT